MVVVVVVVVVVGGSTRSSSSGSTSINNKFGCDHLKAMETELTAPAICLCCCTHTHTHARAHSSHAFKYLAITNQQHTCTLQGASHPPNTTLYPFQHDLLQLTLWAESARCLCRVLQVTTVITWAVKVKGQYEKSGSWMHATSVLIAYRLLA